MPTAGGWTGASSTGFSPRSPGDRTYVAKRIGRGAAVILLRFPGRGRIIDVRRPRVMYFQFVCPSCQKSLKVREENAGGKVRCPYCHETLSVKAPRTQGNAGGAMTPSDSHVL